MITLSSELRVAFRRQLRQRSFTATVVATLALSVGAIAAVFAVVDAVLLRGLPYAEPQHLVWVASVRTDSEGAPFTLPEYMDYRSRTRSLAGLAAFANWSASLAREGAVERLPGARLSANAFAVLGVRPAAGRLLQEPDDHPGAPPIVVLGHRLWQRRFGGSPDVVGRALRINGEPHTVVGVLPRHLPLPLLREVELVTALVPDRDPLRHERSSVNFLRFFARLAPGVDRERAQAELTAICRALRAEHPAAYERKQAVSVEPLQEALVGDLRRPLLMLLAAVAVVLATAMTNVTSLLLVRTAERRGELALRQSVGATPLLLARSLVVEGLLLAAAGSVGAWAVAAAALRLLVPLAPPTLPRLGEVSLGGATLGLLAGVTAVVATLLVVVPLAAVARTGGGAALRPGGRGALGDQRSERARGAFAVAQIAAALVLLLATAALLQALRALGELDPGFAPRGVFQVRVSLPPGYQTPGDLARFHDRLSERLAAAPGVDRVGVISVAPLSGLLTTVPFAVEGTAIEGAQRPTAHYRVVSPEYPQTVGMRLLRGRALSPTDTADSPPVALVSAALAARWLPADPIGRRLLLDDNNVGPRPVEVVGVVADTRHVSLDAPPAFDLYLPLHQLHPDNVGLLRNNQFWMLATAGEPAEAATLFGPHLRAVEPDAATSGSGPMQQLVVASLAPRRFHLGLFGGFASMAVVLVVVGLYGLFSYSVSRRVAEIGLRMAIGATREEVERMVLRRAARLGIAGAASGLVLAAAAWPLVARLAPEVAIEPELAAVVAGLLLAVVLAAAWRPARRASRLAPTEALRIR
jgi:predicted permease